MTAIYDAQHATGYEFANPTNYEDSMILHRLDATPRKETWKPILVTRGAVNRRQKGRPADIPCMHDTLLLRRSAVEALRDILDAHGELLPVATENGIELYVFNTLQMIDALDRE